MAAAKVDPDKIIVSLDYLSRRLGVHKTTICKWGADNESMPKHGRGEYPLVDFLLWVIQRRDAQQQPGDLTEERKRLVIAQRQRQEMENAKIRGELIETEKVLTCLQEHAAVLATQLDGLAPRMAATLAAVDDPAIIQRKLFDACRDVRAGAAGALESLAGTYAGSLDPPPPAEEKRRTVGRRKQGAAARKPRARAVAD